MEFSRKQNKGIGFPSSAKDSCMLHAGVVVSVVSSHIHVHSLHGCYYRICFKGSMFASNTAALFSGNPPQKNSPTPKAFFCCFFAPAVALQLFVPFKQVLAMVRHWGCEGLEGRNMLKLCNEVLVCLQFCQWRLVSPTYRTEIACKVSIDG